MKVFTRDYRISGEYCDLWREYFGDMRPCVLDIEATGLSRTRCKVVLTGLLMRTDKGVTVTQFLAENHYEEAKVLDATMDYIEDNGADYLVTFNGYAYDIPFINARLDACMLGRHLHMYHFDLYRFLRKGTDLRTRLGSMSQMSIENYYGILSDRGDTITGKESVALFDRYAVSGNSTLEKIILTHNREDVLHLHRLMYLALSDIPAEPGFAAEGAAGGSAGAEMPGLHRALALYGFPAAEGRLSVRAHIRKGGKAILRVTGEQIHEPVSCACFPDDGCPVTASFNAGTASYEIEAPVGCHSDAYFIDISHLFDAVKRNDPAAAAEALERLRSDPNCVNDYLILDPRTVNLVSKLLAESYIRF